eukprot:827559-Amphidinium_carterae.1
MQVLRLLQFWLSPCVLQVQRNESTQRRRARSAGPECQACCVPSGGPQEAYCRGQGLPGPTKAVAIHSKRCATAKAGNTPLALQACESSRASQIPCGQDGSTSQVGASSDSEKGRDARGVGFSLLGLGIKSCRPSHCPYPNLLRKYLEMGQGCGCPPLRH